VRYKLRQPRGNLDILDMLIDAKADVEAPAGKYNGRTTLQAAAEAGHLIVVKTLVRLGTSVNAAPSHYSGRTATGCIWYRY